MGRSLATSLLLISFAFLSMEVSSESKMPKSEQMELFNREQLCVMCHAVLDRWKDQQKADADKFKQDLLTSCSLITDPEEAKKCRDGVTEERLAKLKNGGVKEICEQEGICGKDEEYGKMEGKMREEEAELKEKRKKKAEGIKRKLEVPEVKKKNPEGKCPEFKVPEPEKRKNETVEAEDKKGKNETETMTTGKKDEKKEG